METTITVGSWPTPATIEGPTLPNTRWFRVHHGGGHFTDKLQQAIQMSCGAQRWIEWRDVPVVEE